MEAPRVGVLALQGNVREHAAMLERLGALVVEVRTPGQLDGLDGLVLPGGESTTIMRLMGLSGLDRAVQARKDGTITSDQAVDVYFRDFLLDPMSVVQTIYERLEIELTPVAEERMTAFLAKNPHEKRGGHH